MDPLPYHIQVLLLDAAPDALVAVNREGRIVLFNHQAVELFGYSRTEALGLQIELLIPERLRQRHAAYRDGYTANPVARPMGVGMALLALRKDGSEFAAEISLSGVELPDGPIVVAAVRAHLSERLDAQRDRERVGAKAEHTRLEAELHQSRRIESLGLLAGGVAHDFNNELAVIQNYVDFARDTLTERFDEADVADVVRDLATAADATERAADLVRQLLSFGRREVIRPEVLDVNGIVEAVGSLLSRTLAAGIELIVACAPDLSPVFADRGQVRQILLNLANNAVQAMPLGGRLIVETVPVVPSAPPDPNASVGELVVGAPYVCLRVIDSGGGMPPEVRDRAFEPFFTTKPLGEGTGLGLSTVCGIVTQARGTVEIHSQVGVGTTISVFLPAAEPDSSALLPARLPDESRLGTETILIVDDTPAVRALAARILSEHGYGVLTASDGHEAARLASSHDGAIHLLLTDVVMPRMGGKAVAEAVRAARPSVRTMFMSGYAAGLVTEQHALPPGVLLAAKPFTRQELLMLVRAALDAPFP